MLGRRSKYTPETVKKICHAIELGATYELACNYAGIGHDTFHQWRKQKPEFSEAVKQAEGNAVVGWLTLIEGEAAAGSWQAAAWKLERRYAKDYGKTISVDDRRRVAEETADRYGLTEDERAEFFAQIDAHMKAPR